MKARLFIAAIGSIALVPSPAHAWGKTGHRVVAAIADTQLSGLARAHVARASGTAAVLLGALALPADALVFPRARGAVAAAVGVVVFVNMSVRMLEM